MKSDKARFKGMLREFFTYSQLKTDFLKNNRVRVQDIPPGGLPPTRNTKYMYKCVHCLRYFSRKAVEIDHISPVAGPDKEIDDLRSYCKDILGRMLDPGNLTILCKSCHRQKTMRRRNK